jgi:hypothetical protein
LKGKIEMREQQTTSTTKKLRHKQTGKQEIHMNMKGTDHTSSPATAMLKRHCKPPFGVLSRMQAGVCILLVMGFVGGAWADTPVSGPIAGQTWTKANSPYVVVGDILVATLTIQPGVTVVFASNYVFEVAGVLTAVGTQAQPILFTSANVAVGWNSIFFNGSPAGSALGFCRTEGAKNSGVRINNTTVTIHDCMIANNSGVNGGGLQHTGTGDFILNNCIVSNNLTSGSGGGIYVSGPGTVSLTDCSILNNAVSGGGYIYGGGAYIEGAGNAGINGCLFSGNSVSATYTCGGGGAACGKDLTVYDSIFTANSVTGAYDGGGFELSGGGLSASVARLFNVTITLNSLYGYNWWTAVNLWGGGVHANQLVLKNSLVASNSVGAYNGGNIRGAGVSLNTGAQPTLLHNTTVAYNNYAGFYLHQTPTAPVDIRNCIFWKNSAGGQQIGGSGAVAVSYSDVEGGYTGTGNINVNPVFNPANLAILPGSQCIDKGDPNTTYNDSCFPPSLETVRNDMGKDGGPGACNSYPTPPSILSAPRSQNSCLGQTVTFTLTAAGSPPLSYQWYSPLGLINGETNVSLTLKYLQRSKSGAYSVVVTNPYGVTNATAQLNVYDACIDLHMYAGLNISGQQGATYVLSYSTDLANPSGWTPLATNVMGSTPWFYLDMDSAFAPHRFYQAMLKP